MGCTECRLSRLMLSETWSYKFSAYSSWTNYRSCKVGRTQAALHPYRPTEQSAEVYNRRRFRLENGAPTREIRLTAHAAPVLRPCLVSCEMLKSLSVLRGLHL